MKKKPTFKELQAKIDRLVERIEDMQKECKHPKRSRTVEHNGSTGGYDRDTYWNEITCRKCGKFWRENT